MNDPTWATPTLVVACFAALVGCWSLIWNIATWSIERSEERRERSKTAKPFVSR